MSEHYIETPGLRYQIDRFKAMLEKSGHRDHILIRGPRGTGKSLFVKLFQDHSKVNQTIVQLNCAALSPSLIEAELYGYVKGAYTDAKEGKAGHLETADTNKKTVVLEEMNSLPLENQAKLLVFMETGKFFRVGGRQEIETKVRIIATMNNESGTHVRPDLEDRFRIVIDVPPLPATPVFSITYR